MGGLKNNDQNGRINKSLSKLIIKSLSNITKFKVKSINTSMLNIFDG